MTPDTAPEAITLVESLDDKVAPFVESYEFRHDGGGAYTPNDADRAMLEDALHGFIADHVPKDAHRRLTAHSAGEGLREAMIRVARMIPGVLCADGVSDAFLASIPGELAYYTITRTPPSDAGSTTRDGGEGGRDIVARAYADGATDCHTYWRECRPDVVFDREPDFAEAASHYASHIVVLPATTPSPDAPVTTRSGWSVGSISRCPFCGRDSKSFGYPDGNVAVRCGSCGARGPEADSDFDAISEWNARQITTTPSPDASPEGARDQKADRIAEMIDEGGAWRACSGCQESEDGHVSARDYPYSAVYRCQPGGGCTECGGIGVIWQAPGFWDGYGENAPSPDASPDSGEAEDVASGLDHVASALREVHVLGRDGIDDAAFDASMLGQIAACERAASLLRRPSRPSPSPAIVKEAGEVERMREALEKIAASERSAGIYDILGNASIARAALSASNAAQVSK